MSRHVATHQHLQSKQLVVLVTRLSADFAKKTPRKRNSLLDCLKVVGRKREHAQHLEDVVRVAKRWDLPLELSNAIFPLPQGK